MRRLSGVLVAGAMLLLPAMAFAQAAPAAPAAPATQAAPAAPAAPQKFTMEGDLALWSVAIRPDKTADYEQILTKVKDSLNKAAMPEAKQQLAGWRVYKGAKPMPDGNVIYTHVITPVAGADYNILQVLYATVTDPAEQKTLYDLYRGAFAGNLGLSSNALVADMSK